jgi:hypothetical protein
MSPEDGVVAMVAPEGVSLPGGSVGMLLTVGGSTGI